MKFAFDLDMIKKTQTPKNSLRLTAYAFLILLTCCSEPSIQKLEGAAQGTTYHISYWS